MAKIAVVTDSAACVPAQLKHELGIHEIPFELTWDDVTVRDDEAFDPTAFYARFRRSPTTHPTTSQPPLGAFIDLYGRLRPSCDGIVSLHVSGELSATVRTAHLAAEQMDGLPIRIVDTRTATIAEGFVVLAAARAAAAGCPIEQVVAEAERVRQRVDFFAALKSLQHMHHGGRLGEAARLLTSQLAVMPVLNLKAGKVSVVCLAHTWKKALRQIVDLTLEHLKGQEGVHASVFHADALADAEWLRDQILAQVPCEEFYLTAFSPVMGAHTGPDVVGLVFYADH